MKPTSSLAFPPQQRPRSLTKLDERVGPRDAVHLPPVQPHKLPRQLFQVLERQLLGVPPLRQRQEAGAPLQEVVEHEVAAVDRNAGGLVRPADALEQRLGLLLVGVDRRVLVGVEALGEGEAVGRAGDERQAHHGAC